MRVKRPKEAKHRILCSAVVHFSANLDYPVIYMFIGKCNLPKDEMWRNIKDDEDLFVWTIENLVHEYIHIVLRNEVEPYISRRLDLVWDKIRGWIV